MVPKHESCLQLERQELCDRLRRAELIDGNTDLDTIDLNEARALLEVTQPAAASLSETDSPVADVSRAHNLLHVEGLCCGVIKPEAVQQLCHSPWSRQQRWAVSAGCV